MNQRGLTLLEVLVGLGIMALLLVIAVPFVQVTPGATLDSGTRRIATGLREARSAAIRGNRPIEFRIDTASGSFGHERLERLAGGDPPIALSLYTTLDQRLDVAEGTIRFFPDGGSTGGGIILTQGTRRVQLLVDWLTGRVSVARSGEVATGP